MIFTAIGTWKSTITIGALVDDADKEFEIFATEVTQAVFDEVNKQCSSGCVRPQLPGVELARLPVRRTSAAGAC